MSLDLLYHGNVVSMAKCFNFLIFQSFSAFALEETVEIIGSVAKSDMCWSLIHDFHGFQGVIL